MATFVLIEPDAFSRGFSEVGQEGSFARDVAKQNGANIQFHNVRRPVRGIQIKDDTYATLQVRDAQGVPLLLFDAAADTGGGAVGAGPVNSNFLIQQVAETRAEKQQVVLTFGEPYIYFYGEQPRVINVTGILLNTEDFNWRAEWWENYDRYLRGTACVRSRTRVYLSWDDIVVEGYIMSAGAQEVSQERHFVQFQFQMFLTNYQNISNIGDPNAHFAGKAVNLDPSLLSLPGTGDLKSTTLRVRQANLEATALARGEGSNSLLASLRKGNVQDVQNWITEINGQIINTLDFVGRFISGRNIRVPIGFTGSAAFDSEVQLVLASIPGATEIISDPNARASSRSVNLQIATSKLIQGYSATIGPRFLPYAEGAGPGLPLSANTDEFLTRSTNDPTGLAMDMSKGSLYENQQAEQEQAGEKVADVFKAYGIDVEPPKELNLLFKKIMFGIASVGVGMNLSKVSAGTRQALNVTGTIL